MGNAGKSANSQVYLHAKKVCVPVINVELVGSADESVVLLGKAFVGVRRRADSTE